MSRFVSFEMKEMGKKINDKVCGDRTSYNIFSIFINHFLLEEY